MKYYFLLFGIVLIFFNQIFFGKIPFPGDLLVNENPYRTESFQGYNPGTYPTKLQGPDVISQIYPWRYFSVQQLKSGELPHWNPYNFSGNQQLANFQTAVFYPLNFLYLALPFNMAWTLIIMLSPFLAAIFMFIFLRSLKLSEFSSFLGGIAFAFSSYMTVWIEYGNIAHTLLWLPLSLFYIKRLVNKSTTFNLISLITVLSLSILAGYIQGVFYIYLVSFFYFIFLLKNLKSTEKISRSLRSKALKKSAFFLVALASPFLLTSFQILPSFYLFLNSTRGQYSTDQISNLLLPLYYWVTGFVPDFFGNPASRNYWIQGTYIERVMYIGVAFLFFAFISFKAKLSEKKFFIFTAILSLIISTNFPLLKFLYLLPLPVVSTTVPTRELSVFMFSAIVLGAIGIDHWAKNKIKTKAHFIFLSVYIFLFITVLFLWKINIISGENSLVTLRNLLLPSFFAIFTVLIFIFLQGRNLGRILLSLLILFDLLYFFTKITPFSKVELIYPKTSVINFLKEKAGINRYWGYGSAYIKPNFQTFDKTYSPEGNDSLHITAYGTLLASSANGDIPDVLPRPDANIAPGYGSSLADNLHRKRILDLLGVRYILHQNNLDNYDETFPKDKYKLAWQKTPWQVYENKGVLPRFFMASDYKIYNNKSDVLRGIYNKDINLKETLLLETQPIIPIDKNSKGIAELLSYTPNKISFSTKSSGNNFLFLSDNYSEQWEGFVDGRKSKVHITDYSFRALEVPKGEHKVEFIYNSIYLMLGVKISLISLIVLLSFTVWLKENEKI